MDELKLKARELRRNVLDLSLQTGEAHIGGCFSEIEILLSLYKKVLNERDKFIMSKGHCAYPMYVLLREKGYNPKISTHPDIDLNNGICCTTGSLGHGLPLGLGMALARKMCNAEGKIYVLIGDGECQEGTTWESAMIAAHHKLNNLHVIVDRNKLQALEPTEKVMSLGDLEKKFKAFGWDAQSLDGHSFDELIPALSRQRYQPQITIANTVKGKGVSYMENDPKWHTRMPNAEELKIAYAELGF